MWRYFGGWGVRGGVYVYSDIVIRCNNISGALIQDVFNSDYSDNMLLSLYSNIMCSQGSF